MERCLSDVPHLVAKEDGREVACWLHEEPLVFSPAADIPRVSL
jgi:hypothetical protein